MGGGAVQETGGKEKEVEATFGEESTGRLSEEDESEKPMS